MEQVKHAALKNGIDVVAWKDALDGTGMPDIKIPIGHEVVLDKGLADIGDHFGLHIGDHATEAVKEVVTAGHSTVADSASHAARAVAEQSHKGSTPVAIGAGAVIAVATGWFVTRNYFNKKKKSQQQQIPHGRPSARESGTSEWPRSDLRPG
jgi:hypothetical protein